MVVTDKMLTDHAE
jgi:hypothetical protein